MKNKLFLCAAVLTACAFSMKVNAQLEVTSAGNVTASKNMQIVKNVAIGDTVDSHVSLNIKHVGSGDSSPYYGIKSHIKTYSSMPTSPTYGVYGWVDASSSSALVPNYPLVGVFGGAYKSYIAPTTFAAGVAGVAHYYGGIGVYGGIRSDISAPSSMPSDANYAGYFDGTVKVNGTVIATAVSTTSDERQKENIREIQSSLSENLNQLRPVSYTLKQDSMWKYDTDAKELQGVHYGLLAQEVQKVYPELVYKRGDNLSINYTELIPLLIMKVQELSAEVEFLKQEKAEQTYRKAPAANVISEQAVLYQNVPNPFAVDTKIAYQLPESTRNASLYIYNMNGLQVADYPISSFGEGLVIVSAGSLEAGMYLYSLVADGKVIDTKRMILTK